jgi:Arc/MetJ-type ribon-helix-helix transcriptional regulator
MAQDTSPVENANEDTFVVALPPNLVAQIDAQVGSAFVDRDDFMREAVRHYLEYVRQTQNAGVNDLG